MTFTHPKDASGNHKWQTRDGREVRIYAWDGSETYPIHGATRSADGWRLTVWTRDGNFYASRNESLNDLIDAPRKHVRWVNVYKSPCSGTTYLTRSAADMYAHGTRLACIRIEFEEGEGLS